jgi:CHASE2 domain-containing sensor protein
MLSFFTTVAVLYALYYSVVIGRDIVKSKDKSSSSGEAAVLVDFNVQHRPKPATVSEPPETVNATTPAANTPADGEGKKNQQQHEQQQQQDEIHPAKAVAAEFKEGLMDAEELQDFLNDLNIEFIQPAFEQAKPVNTENVLKDAKPTTR